MEITIRTQPRPECRFCGGAGETAYRGLRDRLFGVPGEWTLRRCLDANCGVLWLDPVPIDEDLPRLYDSYYTHEETKPAGRTSLRAAAEAAYLAQRYGYPGAACIADRMLAVLLALSPGHRAQADLKAFGLGAVSGGRLLEVGCGSGAGMVRMSELGWQVEGIDFDEKAVLVARQRGLDVRLGSLEDQNYPNAMFDAVVMSHVLEHVPDPRGLLLECRRVLRAGGQFVCITPNADSLCHRLFECDWRGLEPPRHLQIFTLATLRQLAARVGFDSPEVSSTVAIMHGIIRDSLKLRSRRLGRGGIAAVGRGGARLAQVIAALCLPLAPGIGDELILRAVKGPAA